MRLVGRSVGRQSVDRHAQTFAASATFPLSLFVPYAISVSLDFSAAAAAAPIVAEYKLSVISSEWPHYQYRIRIPSLVAGGFEVVIRQTPEYVIRNSHGP